MLKKQVLGYEEMYEVDEDGNVFSLERKVNYRINGMYRLLKGRKLKPKISKRNYLDVTLCNNGEVKTHRVHKLVAQAFLGKRPKGMQIAHLDGNPANNKISNLKFVTPRENESHKLLHGTKAVGVKNGKYTKPQKTPRGVSHGQSKFTTDEVNLIRDSDISCVKLAKKFKVSKTSILNIKNNKTYV